MTEKKLPHLHEAIDQMKAYIEKETDRNKRIWLGEILESMSKVCWDLQEQ